MNKIFKVMALVILWAAVEAVYAQPLAAYYVPKPGMVFVYFNGALTTADEASEIKERFKLLHGQTLRSGYPFIYEVFYNQTNGFEDFVETFEQRLLEQEGLLAGRYELFFEALHGGGSLWEKIIAAVPSALGILNSFIDWLQAATVRQLTMLLASPPTIDNYAEHKARLYEWNRDNKRLLFVAHSQGNLFANVAYNSGYRKEFIRVVHIAPASPLLNGKHTLADLDLVINLLRAAGSAPSITHTIPSYAERPPGINGRRDLLGHGLLEIYINQSLQISSQVRQNIDEAITNLDATIFPLTTSSLR